MALGSQFSIGLALVLRFKNFSVVWVYILAVVGIADVGAVFGLGHFDCASIFGITQVFHEAVY